MPSNLAETSPCFLPPKGFKITQNVTWAKLLDSPPAFAVKVRRPKKGAKYLGIKYEEKVQKFLLKEYKGKYAPSPWFKYFDSGDENLKWCQPDGIYVDLKRKLIVIVEIKLRHTSAAWWQLERKYLPVVRHLYGEDYKYALVEVCKWFDGTEPFPVPISLRADLADAKVGSFQVTICKPRN